MTISSLADINAPLVNLYTISAIGDSQTVFNSLRSVTDQTWTAQLYKTDNQVGRICAYSVDLALQETQRRRCLRGC